MNTLDATILLLVKILGSVALLAVLLACAIESVWWLFKKIKGGAFIYSVFKDYRDRSTRPAQREGEGKPAQERKE